MKPVPPQELMRVLADHLEQPVRSGPDGQWRTDDGRRFQPVWRPQVAAALVPELAEALRAIAVVDRLTAPDGVIPILGVRHMGREAREACRQLRVNWLDLSGNGHIRAPHLLIHVEGRENILKRPGRPEDPFSTKSARLARALLHAPTTFRTQSEWVVASGLSKSMVSRTVARLEEMALLERDPADATRLRAKNALTLLRTWGEAYRFERHTRFMFLTYARSGEALTRELAQRLDAAGVRHAFTGLSAAWMHAPHASFRLATAFVAEPPTAALCERLDLRPAETGANVWLVVPDDDDILRDDYVTMRDGARCTSPAQTWLDLRSQPERADEAAAALLDAMQDGRTL